MSSRIFLVVMLASLALVQAAFRFSTNSSVDFYHFWGVSNALRMTGHRLGSPYAASQDYADVLNAYAAQSSDPRLKAINSLRRTVDLTGSPLLYASFFFVPEDYSSSVTVFFVLQVLSFFASVVILGLLYRYETFLLLSMSFLLLIAFRPFQSDLRVGNIGCFQLLFFALLLVLAHYLQRELPSKRKVALGALFLTGVCFLALLKPTVMITSILMAMYFGVKHGRKIFLACAIPAAFFSMLFIIIPCLYFRSWGVWADWYNSISGAMGTRMLYAIELGNFSSSLLLSELLHVDVFNMVVATIIVLAVSLVVIVFSRTRSSRMDQPSMRSLVDSFLQIFADPSRATAIGIVLTIASSPLYWDHYYVVSVIPGLWLMSVSPARNHLGVLGMITLVMTSGVFDLFLRRWNWTEVEAGMVALSWIPLWSAILLHVVWAGRAPAREHVRSGSKGRRRS